MVEPHSTPNIFTVVQVLRSFSNEVTVNALAAQLNVSYSTLNRCRSGTCPPSITFTSLKGTFDIYLDTYFGGDEKRACDAILNHLRKLNVPTAEFEKAQAIGGYDNLVTRLLDAALARQDSTDVEILDWNTTSRQTDKMESSANCGNTAAIESTGAAPENASELQEAESNALEPAGKQNILDNQAIQDSAKQELGRGASLAGYLALAVVVAIGLLQLPLNKLLAWTMGHSLVFFVVSLCIAVAPTVLGLVVDAPIAWIRCRRREPDTPTTWHAWQLAAKYGSTHTVAPGEGRFDPTSAHLAYSMLSNVAGMLCAIAMLGFLQTLPGLFDYLTQRNWTEFFKAAVALSFVIAYHHTHLLQQLPRPEHHGLRYNPDNYLYSRVHVWANIVHLAWVISITSILTLCLLGYIIANFRQITLPIIMLWPIGQMALFLLYAYLTPYTARAGIASPSGFSMGLAILSVCMLGVVSCFKFSWTSILAYFICVCLGAIAAIVYMHERRVPGEQVQVLKNMRIYGVMIAAGILSMAAVGLFTSALA